jgi:DNA gyrase subunit B
VDAQFEGQTKAKLGNSEIRTLVDNIVSEKLSAYLEENPAVGRAILEKALTASRAREGGAQSPGKHPAEERAGGYGPSGKTGRLQ